MLRKEIESKNKKDITDSAGMLTEEESDKLLKLVETGRRDGSHKKKYLANWD